MTSSPNLTSKPASWGGKPNAKASHGSRLPFGHYAHFVVPLPDDTKRMSLPVDCCR